MISLSSLGSPGSTRQPPGVTSVVIDTDPGIDDLVTLALAARSPSLEIVAVTTTYGNATLAAATRNAREVLGLAGRSDVQICPGSGRPLLRSLVTAPDMHGPSGAGYSPVPQPQPSDSEPNPDVLLEILAGLDRPITLVTLGPLTNLAQALRKDTALVRARIERHIGMFGSVHERGSTSRRADFNAWCDPEATDRVLRTGLNTFMVGLDVTRQMTLETSEVDPLAQSSDPLVRWLGQALQYYVESHVKQRSVSGCVVNDVLTVGELLSPGMLTFAERRLKVDLDDGQGRGHTREHPGGCATWVATGVDTGQMRRLLGRVLGQDWLDPETAGGSE